jgi:hypothetical protein
LVKPRQLRRKYIIKNDSKWFWSKIIRNLCRT